MHQKEEDPKRKFKDAGGSWLTMSLFREIAPNKAYAIYSTKEYDLHADGQVYPSLKKLYLECEDPTEYEFATKHLGGWTHWQRIVNNKKLRPMVDEWRDELEIKLRSKAIRAMVSTAVTAGSKGTTAAKWIADKGWGEKRGRPSKEEVERQKKIHAGINDEIQDDIDRMSEYLN